MSTVGPAVPLSPRGWALQAAGLAVAYFGLSVAVNSLAQQGNLVAAWWPAAGLTLAILLRAPRARWPLLLAAIVAADLSADLVAGVPPLTSVLWAAANSLEPALGATAILWAFGGERPRQSRPIDIIRAIVAVALVGPPVAAVIGGFGASIAFGDPFASAAIHWYLGDVLGIVVVAPFALNVGTVWAARSWRLGVVLSVEALVAFVSFAGVVPAFAQSEDLVVPGLVVAALLFGMPGATAAGLIVATISYVLTALGHGPFSGSTAGSANLLALQVFTTVQLVTVFVVAGIRAQLDPIQRSEARFRDLSERDPLTGLTSRSRFMDILADRIAHPSSDPEASVLMVDLDKFKEINDSLGHAAGDAVLIEAAGRLRSCVRPADTVARLGGDEFALLLVGVAPSVADRCAERVTAVLGASYALDGQTIRSAGSVGIASIVPHEPVDEPLRRADIALYQAKASGGATVVRYDETLERTVADRRALTDELVAAIAAGELEVFYQPIRTLADQRIVAVEALVRWRHPVRGLLLPAAFLELAQSSGSIVAVGRAVLRAAARQVVEWNGGRDEAVSLHVNLSARELAAPDISQGIASELSRSGLDPHLLVAEVMESAIAVDPDRAREVLTSLRAIGARVALDGFGGRSSSLGYLQDLPAISILKLDRSLIVAGGRRDHVILEAAVDMAQRLVMTTVAEGIETGAQREIVVGLGCEQGQGYLLGRPADAATTGALLSLTVTTERARKPVPLERAIEAGPIRRILVINHHLPTLKLLGLRLRLAGFEPLLALTAEEAEQIVGTAHPDLVLVDLRMPGMDGPELVRAMRTHPELDDVRFVACSVVPLAHYRGGAFVDLFDGELTDPVGSQTTDQDFGEQVNAFLRRDPAWDREAQAAPSGG